MKFIGFFTLLLIPLSCYSVKKTKYNTVYKIKDYGLPESINTPCKPFYFMYDQPNIGLVLWSDDSIHYSGKIICYTVRHLKRRNKYYAINFRLADSVTTEIIKRFKDNEIAKILQGDTLKSDTTVSYSHWNESYRYSNCQKSFHKIDLSLRAGRQIQPFENFIEKQLDPKKRFDEFLNYLPNGVYQQNMIEVTKGKPADNVSTRPSKASY